MPLRRRLRLTAALLASLALNLLMLAVPLYSMQVYDRVLWAVAREARPA